MMNNKSYKADWSTKTDSTIVKEICKNVKQMRLRKNISQSDLSKLTGIHRVTISRMETGSAPTLLTLVQVLRALDKLELLEVFIIEPELSPIQLLKIQAKQRQKATPRKKEKMGDK